MLLHLWVAIFPILLEGKDIIVSKGNNFAILCDESQEHGTSGVEVKKGNVTLYRSSNPNDESFNWYKYDLLETGLIHKLVVKRANFDDAHIYRCFGVESKRVLSSYSVIVTEKPSIHSDGSHIEDEDLTTRCRVEFMYPEPSTCNEDACPSLEIVYLNNTANETIYECRMLHKLGPMLCSAQVVFPHKPKRNEDGVVRTCTMSLGDFEDRTSSPLIVKYPVTKPYFRPDQETYSVGQYISCDAMGNPHPDYLWVNLQTNEEINCKKLHLTDNMTGHNIWKCLAENEPGTQIIIKESTMNFEVVPLKQESSRLWIVLIVTTSLFGIFTVVVIVRMMVHRCKPTKKGPNDGPEEEEIVLQLQQLSTFEV